MNGNPSLRFRFLERLQESIDTTSGGRLIFRFFGALAEFERKLTLQRTCSTTSGALPRTLFKP